MTDSAARRAAKIFAVLNPVSGRTDYAALRATLERQLSESGLPHEIYETSGQPAEDLTAIVRDALGRGFDTVVASGGDGTVSAVAEGLIGTAVPLAIIPAGTANVFARELKIPIDIEGACALIIQEHTTAKVDAMRVGDQHFILQIDIGIGSYMIRNTSREAKGRFGRLAYLWTAANTLMGFQPRRFMLTIDGVRHRHSASEVMLANGGMLGVEPFRWGDDIHPDDGQIDICLVSARTVNDYLGLFWHTVRGKQHRSQRLRYFKARKSITVNTKERLPIQADGEIIGTTPLQVTVVPGALQVVVPIPTAAEQLPVEQVSDSGMGELVAVAEAVVAEKPSDTKALGELAAVAEAVADDQQPAEPGVAVVSEPKEEVIQRLPLWQAIDTRIFLAINHLPHTPLTDGVMYSLTTVMNGGWGWVGGLLARAIFGRRRNLKILREVLPPLWIATLVVEHPIKSYFRRKRPFISVVKAIAVGRKPSSFSFPSGHSAAAFAGAWLISRHYPKLARLWYFIASLVGFSRIYLGAHYPGDVLVGALTGTLIAEGSRRAIDWLDGSE